MISNRYIKELAGATLSSNGEVNNKIAGFILNKLTKKELKVFLRKLKKINNESNVKVRYEGNMTVEIKKTIQQMYLDKNIIYEKDDNLGGGIMIIDNDMIVNYTVGGILDSRMKAI